MATKKTAPVNDEFDLDAELEAEVEQPVAEKKAAAKPKAAAPKQKFIDPEDDKKNWPTILIDSEKGKPNYEYLETSGTKKNGKRFVHRLQVQRGVEVQVPPSIVHDLEDAITTEFAQHRDPVTGKNNMLRSDRSAIPWRIIKSGKYLR